MPPQDFAFWVKSLWGQLHSLLPAVIYYHTYFLLIIISHVGGSNEVNTGPMKHWLPASLTTPTLFKSQNIALGGRNLVRVRNIVQIYSSGGTRPPKLHNLLQFSPSFHPLHFMGLPPRVPQGSAIHVFLVLHELFLLIIFT